MAFYNWSTTPNNNASADPTINFAEGQAPSSLNDSNRAGMARLREWGNDIAGAIVTAGTSTAYTVSSNQNFDTLAHLAGQVIAFSPHITNAAGSPSVTLNVDSLGAKPVRSAPNVDIQSGVLVQGTPYAALYNNSDGAFYLFGVGEAPGIPLGAGIDYWATTTPSSAFAFPSGQAISRTTYSGLFALMGTTYGSGDGSTTFNLPDKTGRVSAMKEATATRLTSSYFGGNSTNMGAVGGSENHTLSVTEMPAHTHPNTLTDPGHAHAIDVYPSSGNGGTFAQSGSISGTNNSHTAATGITLTNASQGGGAAHPIVQPTIICNYVIRII